MIQSTIADRALRQREIIPPDRLAACRATVIGVGAIGRQAALQLAAIGLPSLHLIDPDRVEIVNLACQGYLEADLNRPKVEATADLCRRLNPQVAVETVVRRFGRSMGVGNIVFSCVDSIETRRLIWQSVHRRVSLFTDGRMSAEVLRVLTACDAASRAHYPTTLFAADRAWRGACTARSTIYSANIAAGLMVCQFTRWLRRLPVDADLQLNLLAGELSIPSDGGAITTDHPVGAVA